MEQSDFDKAQKEKKIEVVVPKPFDADKEVPVPPVKQFEQSYASLLQLLRTVRQPVSTAPTFVPRNFLEQFQLYENGATYRLYVYVNGTWRYTALT